MSENKERDDLAVKTSRSGGGTELAPLLTTLARTLGGSAAAGLLAAVALPALPIVTVLASVAGLLGGFLVKKLDDR
jgi:hypothetical protein